MSKLIDLAIKTNTLKKTNCLFLNKVYLVNEENNIYNSKYKIGDIVFVKEYKYSDDREGINHLFVIVEDNYICMLLSSKLDKLKFSSNKCLVKNNQNGLRKDSVIKMDYIYQIKNEDILFKIGSVSKREVNLYKKSYIKLHLKN